MGYRDGHPVGGLDRGPLARGEGGECWRRARFGGGGHAGSRAQKRGRGRGREHTRPRSRGLAEFVSLQSCDLKNSRRVKKEGKLLLDVNPHDLAWRQGEELPMNEVAELELPTATGSCWRSPSAPRSPRTLERAPHATHGARPLWGAARGGRRPRQPHQGGPAPSPRGAAVAVHRSSPARRSWQGPQRLRARLVLPRRLAGGLPVRLVDVNGAAARQSRQGRSRLRRCPSGSLDPPGDPQLEALRSALRADYSSETASCVDHGSVGLHGGDEFTMCPVSLTEPARFRLWPTHPA